MKYVSNDEAGVALLDQVAAYQNEKSERKAGLHVSDLIYCRRKAWYRLHEFNEAPRTANGNLTMMLGTALGAMIEELFNSEVSVTLDLDGIPVFGTLDLLTKDADGILVGEIKETRSSARKAVEDMGYYVEQIASYCIAEKTNHARLYLAHLLGDYTGPKLPQFKTWDVYFSDEELEAFKHELTERAKSILSPSIPSTEFTHWVFECDGCPYSGVCPGGTGYKTGFFSKDDDDA